MSFETLKKLCDEWKIKTLPHSYWKRMKSKNWKQEFDEKFKDFQEKYLADPS